MDATFSIVVPTYARPDRLAQCVASMCALDYPRDRFEVVIVDDGSPGFDAVEAAVAPYRERLDLQLVNNGHAGPATTRNTGAARAKYEFIAFTDDDCRVDPGWLTAYARRLAQAPEAIAGGRTMNALTDNVYTSASEALVAYFRDYHLRKGTPFFATNNLAIAKKTFDLVGGFDERFPLAAGEDRDFCDRCVKHGYALVYVPDAVVTHYHALSFRRFLRQHFNYGRGAFFYRQLNTARGGGDRVEVEPLKFYVDLVSYPLSNADRHKFTLTLLLLMSQVANSAGFFLEKTRRGTTS